MDGDRMSFDDNVTRRSALFGTAALGSTYAFAVQPVQAQTMIVTPTDGLTAGAVKVKTKDGKEMDAYRAMPASGTGFGTILVVQEIWGVHAHIADMCRRFAKAATMPSRPNSISARAIRRGHPTPKPSFATSSLRCRMSR